MYIEMIHCVNVNNSVKSCSVETEHITWIFSLRNTICRLHNFPDYVEHIIHVTKVLT